MRGEVLISPGAKKCWVYNPNFYDRYITKSYLEYLVDRELQPFRHAEVFLSSLFEELCRLFDVRSTWAQGYLKCVVINIWA